MKKFLFVAVLSLAAMFSFSSCEKDSDGNGGDNVGKPKPLKSFVLTADHSEIYRMVFNNDDNGRIIQADFLDNEGYGQKFVFEYGDDFCRVTKSYDGNGSAVYQYVMKDGRAISCTYSDNYYNETGDFQYKYDESGHLTEIIQISDSDGVFSKVTTKLEWENDCVKSWYEEEFDAEENMSHRQKHVYHYGKEPSIISNFNYYCESGPFTSWAYDYMFNLFGKQYKYLPVKVEAYYSEFMPEPGQPDDFGKYGDILDFKYELNKDKTISKAFVKAGHMDISGFVEDPTEIEYILNY